MSNHVHRDARSPLGGGPTPLSPYLIEILIGPCLKKEAVDFMNELRDAAELHNKRFVGASFSLGPYEPDDSR